MLGLRVGAFRIECYEFVESRLRKNTHARLFFT